MTDTPNVRAQAPLAPGMRPRPSGVEIGSVICGLFAFITLAIWGFTAWPFPWSIVAGIGAPVLAIAVWALFVSPRAVLAVHPFVRAIVELFVYAAATVAWWSMGQALIGLVFAIVAVTFGALNGRRRLA
ncbi:MULTISPECIES: YrdB family protein [Microbacterium]|uniref:YrdB family protein n=1 Tax=Microbacterium TaxID=33882 RepID=UPI001642FE61|nr:MULTISPECIES: YrdB family protein [Microbacterium]MCD2169063.1 YrdB family protein [Microbacterium sp. JC 701]MCM3500854.1 YrdB family protein [Microbacterium sp. P26]MDQ1172998.1 membrane protein YdbS with pleckstrin-like domain [Microbacterium testaceum]